MTEKIKTARQMLGRFFKERREELGVSEHKLASQLSLSAETIKGIESGRFAWDIDTHLRICEALRIRHELIASDEVQPNYIVQPLADGSGYICTDTTHLIAISWQSSKFNETQKASFLNNKSMFSDPGPLATVMRNMGDWLSENHAEKL